MRRGHAGARRACRELVVDGTADVIATASSSVTQRTTRTLSAFSQTSTDASWRKSGAHRVVDGDFGSLIHPETHFTDERAGILLGLPRTAPSATLAVHQ